MLRKKHLADALVSLVSLGVILQASPVCTGAIAGIWHLDTQQPAPALEINSSSLSPLGRILQESKSISIIGDSISAGSENGGFPWYLPLMAAFPHLSIDNIAQGGETSKSALQKLHRLQKSDAYLIALGTNDVRYRDPAKGAMSVEEYTENISRIIEKCLALNPEARLIFIAPWCSIPEDPIPPLTRKQKEQMQAQYAEALKKASLQFGGTYVDPTPQLRSIVYHKSLCRLFLMDHIHPRYPEGCYLYSAAVWEASFAPQN